MAQKAKSAPGRVPALPGLLPGGGGALPAPPARSVGGRGGAMARMLALALVAAALRGALAQRAGMRPGEEEAEAAWTCEARYNGTSCLLDHLVDAQGRDTWPARGLINGSDLRIYFTEGHHAPVIEDIVHFIRHAFLDENVKSDARMANLFNGPSPPPPPPIRTAGNPLVDVPPPPPVPNAPNRPPAAYLHVLNAGSHDGAISYCYFPMLYYTCAASYQVCKEDTNRTEQLIWNPPPTPANLDLELLPEIEMEWAKTAQTLAMTPFTKATKDKRGRVADIAELLSRCENSRRRDAVGNCTRTERRERRWGTVVPHL